MEKIRDIEFRNIKIRDIETGQNKNNISKQAKINITYVQHNHHTRQH